MTIISKHLVSDAVNLKSIDSDSEVEIDDDLDELCHSDDEDVIAEGEDVGNSRFVWIEILKPFVKKKNADDIIASLRHTGKVRITYNTFEYVSYECNGSTGLPFFYWQNAICLFYS